MTTIKAFYKAYSFQLLLLVCWLVAWLVVWPVGEFLVNDEWAYAKNVYQLVVNKKFVVDQWPAMNLISQTLYGSAITGLFGFSFTTLRLGIFILAAIASLYLFKLVKQLAGNNNVVAFVFTATFSFNAMYLHLSMTYMTDVFFASLLIFCLYHFMNYQRKQQPAAYAWFCFWCIMAMLCRQHALIIGLLMVPVIMKQQKSWPHRLFFSALPVLLSWLASDQYRHFLSAHHIPHNIQKLDKMVDYLMAAPLEKHVLQSADLLLTIGWSLLPVAVYLLLSQWSSFTKKDRQLLLITTLFTVPFTLAAFGKFPIGNISIILEIGPRLIKGAGKAFDFDYVILPFYISYVIAYCSIHLLVFFSVKQVSSNSPLLQSLGERAMYLLVALLYFLFVAVGNAYFDRYAIPLLLLLLLFIVPPKSHATSSTKYVLVVLLSISFTYSLVVNCDYFNWQKKRLAAIQYLQSKNIPSHDIDGGFEFNGWAKTNNTYPTDPRKSWWWVVDDKYIISPKPSSGMHIDTLLTYRRYLPPGIDTLLVLRRNNQPE